MEVIPTGMLRMTSTKCIDCGKAFPVGVGVHLATIKVAVGTKGDVQETDVTDDEGDLLYDPLFFHSNCLKELDDGLHEIVVDQPPFENDDAILECDFCSSGILALEVFCRIQFGEMRVSPRRPAGQMLHQFDGTGCGSRVMCISCMAHVCEQVLEIWATVGQQGECAECQHVRCWRDDTCSLDCDCHKEEEEEERELYERGDEVRWRDECVENMKLTMFITPPTRGRVQEDEDEDGQVIVAWNDGNTSAVDGDDIELVN